MNDNLSFPTSLDTLIRDVALCIKLTLDNDVDYILNFIRSCLELQSVEDLVTTSYTLRDLIVANPRFVCIYARLVLNGQRWYEAEPYIIDSECAIEYAKYIIKDRWVEAEKYILSTPKRAYGYAWSITKITKKRYPEIEKIFANYAKDAYFYCTNVLGCRWPEAEPAIMRSPFYAVSYAKEIIKGRWEEAEPFIMEHEYASRRYSKEVIKGPWPEAGIKDI